MPEIGVAGSVEVKHLAGVQVDHAINRWIEKNPNVEIIDVKMTSAATNDEWMTDVLIIYRKEIY